MEGFDLPRLNPALLQLAGHTVRDSAARLLEKSAIVPAGGGMPPMDPAAAGGGGMPPADPSMGGGAAPPPPAGGAGMDPAVQAQIQQAVQQQTMMGGAGGKPGGKKLEQQIVDTKLWTIQYIVAMIADNLGIKLPPSLIVGPPPDPNSMQMAQADSATMQGGSSAPMQDPAMAGGAPGGAPGGGGPIQPPGPVEAAMPQDPAAGGGGKMASIGVPFRLADLLDDPEDQPTNGATKRAELSPPPAPETAGAALAARARELGRRATLASCGA